MMSNNYPPPAYGTVPPPAYNYNYNSSAPKGDLSSSQYAGSAQHAAPHVPQVPQQEVKIWQNAKERRVFEDMADLYAIIKTTEHLESAYVRDAITQDEYTEACSRLISQYKTAENALRTAGHVASVESFIAKYRLDCPRATERLLKIGVPATVIHNTTNKKGDSVNVAQTVQNFITLMDSLKLNVRAVDEIQPLISEMMSSLTQVSGLPPSFDGRVQMETWLRKLNSMRASDELDEDQARQLSYELDKAYTSFISYLNK